MHKINAYVRADGLAVYCKHCTVDKGSACTFRLMKTAQPVSDDDACSGDAMECSDDELPLEQWYWRCNLWQPHLPSCKPTHVAKDGTSQTIVHAKAVRTIWPQGRFLDSSCLEPF